MKVLMILDLSVCHDMKYNLMQCLVGVSNPIRVGVADEQPR